MAGGGASGAPRETYASYAKWGGALHTYAGFAGTPGGEHCGEGFDVAEDYTKAGVS